MEMTVRLRKNKTSKVTTTTKTKIKSRAKRNLKTTTIAESISKTIKNGKTATLLKYRSQTLAMAHISLLLLLLLPFTCPLLTSCDATNTTKTSSTTTTQPPNYNRQASQSAQQSSSLRLEEEVEILTRPTPISRRLKQPGMSNSSRPHVYRVRASAPLNGRLTLPANPLLVRPEEPPAKALFGTRATRPTQLPTRPPTAATESCRETPEERAGGEQGSIAASSPTLRLTATERRPPLFVGPQPLPSGELEESVAESRDNGKQTAAAAAASTGAVRETGSGNSATQSTLLNSRATPTSGLLRRLGANVLGPLRLSEVSLLEGNEESPEAALTAATSSSKDSILSLIDEYDSKIITNRTKAQLSCDSGEMILRLNFSEPFKGIVYPDHNRLSACRFFGDGHLNYELRLPLRGCGTRQAASRVFVNDVIVRFHKALELEEDEVKTLICRYPPPLAPSAQTIKTNSLKSSSTTTTTEAGESDQSQFEFVDPQSGQPSNSLSSNAAGEPPGSSGNIETLSENLVVAPSGGHLHNNQQATNQLESLNPYATAPNGNRQQQQLNNRLLVPPSSNANNNDLLFKQRNSFNNLIEPITIDSALPNSPPTTASPSSYFERLSSVELLFLISSLLFLILLALGLVGSLYCFRLRAVVGQNRASAILRRRKRRYVGAIFDQVAAVAPSATLQHHHHYQNQQQQYAIAAAAAAAAAANAHQLPLTAPSSPESDLSGRAGLLAGSSGSMSNQQQAAYLFNRNSHYLSNQQHRHRQSRQQHYNGVHYGNSSKRASNNQLPTTGRRSLQQQQQVAHNQPVVGRREGLYGNAYTNYAAPGRPVARRSSPHRAQHHLYLRPTYLQPELSKSHEPLVTTISGEHEQAIRAHRYGRPVAQQQREASSTLHRAHQVYIDQQQRRNPSQQLWRAKSLSSFPQPVEVGGALSNNRLLSRQTAAIKSGTIAGKHSKRLAQTPEVRRGNSSCSSNDDCDIDHNRSWQRTFERNNNLLELLTREKPKIVLKSIEDSYITKLTEIEEQEYMKRDSTKPLDLATWRAMQPSGQLETGATNEQQQQQQRMNLSSAESSDDEELLEGLASAHTNLRSLTELDVNYVRTLPRPGTPVAQKASSSSPPTTIRASVSADRLLDEPARTHQSAGKAQVNYEQQRRRSNSEPDVTSGAGGGHQSPDLIVSAEYDCSRLELEESHNSVSYV